MGRSNEMGQLLNSTKTKMNISERHKNETHQNNIFNLFLIKTFTFVEKKNIRKKNKTLNLF